MAQLLNVSAESLATYAGIINSDQNNSENKRLLKTQLGIIQHQTRSSGQSPTHYEFAAKYTPALVDKFRAKDEVLSSSVTLLNVISHTPYFIRFLQTPARQGIASLQAKRTAEAVSLIDSMPSDEATLIPKLKQWKRHFPGTLASEASQRCIEQLRNDIQMQYMMKVMKDMLKQSLNCCGAPECEQKHQENGSDLMQCSRCKSAVYCGTDHQRKAWATHKALCFPASF
ncbi:hypothetical protein E4T56_gene812 [Termitomyces sp. T112]|nr:hypothetical protein E4T56_gene812 [Termitomyces sp. T112]